MLKYKLIAEKLYHIMVEMHESTMEFQVWLQKNPDYLKAPDSKYPEGEVLFKRMENANENFESAIMEFDTVL